MNPCQTAFELHHRWNSKILRKRADGYYAASYVRILYADWIAAWNAAKEVQQGTIDSLRDELNERRD